MPISKTSVELRRDAVSVPHGGVCYRLYSEDDCNSWEDSPTPEILRQPLTATVVKLRTLGIDPAKFDWIETNLPQTTVLGAVSELTHLGVLDKDGTGLTKFGESLANLQLEPEIARMVVYACAQGFGA